LARTTFISSAAAYSAFFTTSKVAGSMSAIAMRLQNEKAAAVRAPVPARRDDHGGVGRFDDHGAGARGVRRERVAMEHVDTHEPRLHEVRLARGQRAGPVRPRGG